MGYSDAGRTSLKNNKRSKQKMFDAYKKIPTKREFRNYDENPHIKNMSKSDLKKYRKKLELEAKRKKMQFWFSFIALFLVLFIYLIVKM